MVQDSYNYNNGPIESHIWSIEPRHFQRSWTTVNQDFKVRPVFDAEVSEMAKDAAIVTKNGLRIGNRTQAFKWFSMILSDP